MQLIILLPIVNTNRAYACNALELPLPLLSRRSSTIRCNQHRFRNREISCLARCLAIGRFKCSAVWLVVFSRLAQHNNDRDDDDYLSSSTVDIEYQINTAR